MTRLRNFGVEVIGWALLILAVLVSPLPVLPSLLLLAALFILSSRYLWASRLLEKARRLLPARLSNAVPAEQPPSLL
jgi:hypothetical protein